MVTNIQRSEIIMIFVNSKIVIELQIIDVLKWVNVI